MIALKVFRHSSVFRSAQLFVSVSYVIYWKLIESTYPS